MEKLKRLYQKHGDILRYLVIGGVTTGIDLVTFSLLYNRLGFGTSAAKTVATVLAVAFAFVGNKWIVFRTKTSARSLAREAFGFAAMRALTYLFSIGFLYVTVDVWGLAGNAANLLCNVIVIVLNYVFSKLVVFKKR